MAESEHLPAGAALLGGGLIGGGWAARLVLSGVDVRLFDPAPEVERGVRAEIDRARRAWRRLTTVPLPPEGTLTVVESVEQAVQGAELVQESAPEREPLKRDLLARASRAAGPDAVIATSTSGLLPSRLAADMDGPDRLVVGHPFNPAYLIPLIEVCAGERTSPETVRRATAIYRALGMRPLLVRNEIDAFIADRLQQALWREALWLVADDVATTAEIDDAIRYGPGLRWAAMGSFLTFRLGGGREGMRHFLAQFGPALKLPWTKLTDVPELDDRLIDTIVRQTDAQTGGRDVEELARIRDDCLVSVLLALKAERYGAGEEIARAEQRLLDRAPAERLQHDADGRLTLHEALVLPEWIDYNGQMTDVRYLELLAAATAAFLRVIGIDSAYVTTMGSYSTVETHIRRLAQARSGDRLEVDTHLLHHDDQRLHVFHEARRLGDGAAIATGEHMLLHIDHPAGRARPAPPEVMAALERIAERQRGLQRPAGAGGRIDAETLGGG